MTSLSQILSDTSDRTALINHLKNYLSKKRQEIHDLHKDCASGLYIVTRISSLTDRIITELYNHELNKFEKSRNISIGDKCTIIAVGGYGRGELNPHSDIDIMFLYHDDAKDAVETISTNILYLLWDLKFNIGHSVRTTDDCIKIRNVRAYIDERLKNMRERYKQFGTSIYLVEPNVKEGKGGLRDIHCLRWVIIARYRLDSLAEFHKRVYITKVGYQELTEATDFLLRVRNELHLHANKASDVLTVEDQCSISKLFGYTDEPHRLGQESSPRVRSLPASRLVASSSRMIEK